MIKLHAALRLTAGSDIAPIDKPIVCAHCGKKASTGVKIAGKAYAKACAADLLGLRPATLNKLLKG